MSVREPGVHVVFEMYPVLHGLESKAAGREVYVDRPHARISVAGYDKDEVFVPANAQIQARFPEEWEAFQKGAEEPATGTPVNRWPQLTVSQVKMLQNLNIRTVEDVATLSDISLQKIGQGGQKLRADAQKFLSLAQAAADVEQMDELRQMNKSLMDDLAAVKETMAALQKQAADHAAEVQKAEKAVAAAEKAEKVDKAAKK